MQAFRGSPSAPAGVCESASRPARFHLPGLAGSQRRLCTDLKCFLRGQYPVTYLNVLNSARLYASMAHQNGGFRPFTNHFGQTRAKMRFVDHHLAHAISAYSYSGLDHAAVVVMDGRGAWEASSIWFGHGGRLDHVLTIPWPNSLGLFYAQVHAVSRLHAQQRRWKVMAWRLTEIRA